MSNRTQRKQKSSVKHTCEFKFDKNTKCGLHFDYRYKLAKHRKQVGHQVPCNQQPCTSTQENTMSYYLQTVEANMHDNRFSTMIANIFNENNDQEMYSHCEQEMDGHCEQEMDRNDEHDNRPRGCGLS